MYLKHVCITLGITSGNRASAFALFSDIYVIKNFYPLSLLIWNQLMYYMDNNKCLNPGNVHEDVYFNIRIITVNYKKNDAIEMQANKQLFLNKTQLFDYNAHYVCAWLNERLAFCLVWTFQECFMHFWFKYSWTCTLISSKGLLLDCENSLHRPLAFL